MILAFSEKDPIPVLPNFSQNAQLSLGTRYGEKIRLLLKLRTCTFKCATQETLSAMLAFSVDDPLPDHPNFPPNE